MESAKIGARVAVVATVLASSRYSYALCNSALQGATISESRSSASARWLYETQRLEAPRARIWRYAWTGINGGFAVGSFILIPFVSKEKHLELAVSGVGSTISTVATLLWPLEVEATLNREFLPRDPCGELHVEEERASSAAADEASRVTWPWHLLNLAVGGIYFGIVGFGTNRWENAFWDGVSALAIGEAQVLTQPTRLSSRLESYRGIGHSSLRLSSTALVSGQRSFQICLFWPF